MTDRDEWLAGERTSFLARVVLAALGLVGAVVASQLIVEAASADDTIAAVVPDDEPGAVDSVIGAVPATGSVSGIDTNAERAAEEADTTQGSDESTTGGGSKESGEEDVVQIDCPPLFVLNFAVGSAEPDNPDPTRPATLALWLAANPTVELGLDGHADADGSEDANLRLSFRRAEAAAALMIEAGVAPEQLQARGFGEYQPLAGEAADSERNRRVTMQVPGLEECPAGVATASGAETNDEESNS